MRVTRNERGEGWQAGGQRSSRASWGQVWRTGLEWGALLEFAKLGLPGGAMMALDAGSWDITTAMAASLGASPFLPVPHPRNTRTPRSGPFVNFFEITLSAFYVAGCVRVCEREAARGMRRGGEGEEALRCAEVCMRDFI